MTNERHPTAGAFREAAKAAKSSLSEYDAMMARKNTTTQPKPLDLPPMPEYHDEPAATNQDAEWRHIHDLKKWGRQLAEIAQAQAALAEGLAEALDSALQTAQFESHPFRPWRKEAREALAKYRENRHV